MFDNSQVIEELIRKLPDQAGAIDLLIGLIDQQIQMATQRAIDESAPRVLHDGAEIKTISDGTEIWSGPSRFPVFNFKGGTAYIHDRYERNQVDITGGGGGADCMFDFLVSSCFSSLSGFTEGMTFTSLSGCTFKGYSTFQGVMTYLDANSTNGGKYTVYLCGITTESVTLAPPSLKWEGLYVYGSGWQHSGITGTLSLGAGTKSSTDIEFFDVTINTVSADGGGSQHPKFNRCKIGTVTNTVVSVLAYIGLELRDCWVGSVIGGTTGTWDNTVISRCLIDGGSIDISQYSSGSNIRITDNWLNGQGSQIKLLAATESLIAGNRWAGSPDTATTTQIVLATGSYIRGMKIEHNGFQSVVGSGSTISVTGTGFCEMSVIGNTFEYGGGSPSNFITCASTATVVAAIVGNNFEPRNTTPTFLEDDGLISISGKFVKSVFGPNTPANFSLELLTGSSGNLYFGSGSVTGAGSSGVLMAPVDAEYLTLATATGLSNERVFTPRNNEFATDNGANSSYLLDSWKKGADIASADPLVLGTDGDYFHVTGTAGIAGIYGAYKNAVLADSPRAYYRMGESSGQPQDSSGNAMHTIAAGTGATYSQTGAIPTDANTAIKFDGTGSYFAAADNALLDLASTFTLEGWIKKAANGTYMTIVDKGTNAYQFRMNDTNQLELVKSGIAIVATSVATITDTVYHHVVATKSPGATPILYIDGSAVALASSATTDFADTAAGLALGRQSSVATQFWNGTLDEIAVYATALSATRIAAHYTAGLIATGMRVLLEFDGACVLTHSSTFILQGAVNYTTVAGDVLEFIFDGAGIWREINRHGSTALGGAAPNSSQYLTLAADATLTSERIWTPGNGLQGADGGAGAAYTAALGALTALWNQTGNSPIYHAGSMIIGDPTGTATITGIDIDGTTWTGRFIGIASAQTAGLIFSHHSSSLPTTIGAGITMGRSRGSYGTPTIISSGDLLGRWRVTGYDGAHYQDAASIFAYVDGTPGLNDMPGRLVFSTTADGAKAVTERMRINNAGRVSIGSAADANASAILDLTNAANLALLLPQIATASLPAGVNGLLVYDSTTNTIKGYVNGAYVSLVTAEHHVISAQVDVTVASTTVPYQVVGPMPIAGTITGVEAKTGENKTCGATSAIFDVHKILAASADTDGQGTTIFTTQANRPTISNTHMLSTTTAPDVTAFAAGDYFAIYTDQSGTTLTVANVGIKYTNP